MPSEPTRLTWYRTADGRMLKLELPLSVSRALATSDSALRRNLKKVIEHSATFTGLAGADEQLEFTEAEGRKRILRSPDGKVPTPGKFTVLVGIGMQWPVAPTADGKCGACRGRRLGRDEYCIVCDGVAPEVRECIPKVTRSYLTWMRTRDGKPLRGGSDGRRGKGKVKSRRAG